jgi:hypothetical protein
MVVSPVPSRKYRRDDLGFWHLRFIFPFRPVPTSIPVPTPMAKRKNNKMQRNVAAVRAGQKRKQSKEGNALDMT